MSRQGPAQLLKRETWVLASSSNEQNRTEYRKTPPRGPACSSQIAFFRFLEPFKNMR